MAQKFKMPFLALRNYSLYILDVNIYFRGTKNTYQLLKVLGKSVGG